MALSTRALILYGPKDLRLETVTLSPPGDDELQISLRSITLCGSDLHYYNSFRNGSITVKQPLILGHESSGVVTAIGNGVPNFKIGDRVALEVGIPCGECAFCCAEEEDAEKLTRYNLCEKMRFRSSARGWPHEQGVLQERINHPSRLCYLLRDKVTLDQGALIEPLSVAIHATRRAGLNLDPHGKILIFGAGAVGLLCAYVAKRTAGPDSQITITDIDNGRLQFALSHGFADHIHLTTCSSGTLGEKLEEAQDTATSLIRFGAPGSSESLVRTSAGFSTIYECTGAESSLQTAIHAAKPGANIMLVGMGTPIQMLPISAAAMREVNLCGVFRYAHTYQFAIDMFADVERRENSVRGPSVPLVDLEKLITHRFVGLERGKEAFEMAGRKEDEVGKRVIKVVIELDEESTA
ncbi:MAG: hypothetical protein MMC33_008348 [Icmadophila ericetorum]|nr:hypothetical protein [Icmadophila ericetorum]